MYGPSDFVMLPIPISMYSSVCALLGGGGGALNVGGGSIASQTRAEPSKVEPAKDPLPPASSTVVGSGTMQPEPAPSGGDAGEVDAAGWPWSPELHASTKGKTKDGLWRMKVGVARPDPKPGFPKADGAAQTGATGTPSNGEAAQAGGSANVPNAGQAIPDDEEDEFAAFRAAAAASNQADANAAAAVPARQWTDSDLGALCNQAAQKLGDPAPVKAIIAQFVPEGQVPHSRNVPADKRADFAAAVEQKAGIQFAG